jgi:hypothetical protein
MGDLTEAMATGDPRTQLVAMRDHLARRLEEAEDRSAAPIAARLADVVERLADLPDSEEVDSVDDLASRRTRRRAAAQG